MRRLVASVTLLAAALGACTTRELQPARQPQAQGETPVQASRPACTPGNGGIELPSGFCAVVVADSIGRARHLQVAPNGDVYVTIQNLRGAETPGNRGKIIALRDTAGDGRADIQQAFGLNGGTGLALRDGYLYFAPNDAVLRYRLGPGQLVPTGSPDTIVRGLPDDYSHTAKSIEIGADGALYVNIGSPGNACQPVEQDRAAGGLDPCPQLDTRAGVWRFNAQRTGQRQQDGVRWATGLRNAVAVAANPVDGHLYAVQHGRDNLAQWPGFQRSTTL